MHPPGEEITTKQAAAELGVSARTIARWVKDNTMHPHVRFPGTTGPCLFTRAEIDRVKKLRETSAA